MADSPPRRIVKLKIRTGPGRPQSISEAPAVQQPPKIKLKIGGGPKADETSLQSPKIKLSKPKKDPPPQLKTATKRELAGAQNGDTQRPIKKLKLKASRKTPTTPYLRIKSKGRPPPRPLGVGYDSEASDREVDPAIEEEFVLRMQPGEDCDYIRKAIAERNWGKQGADVRIKFLQTDGRRAVVIVRGHIYAATLVDMPSIVEGMKSWDRRGWFKSADICQMLLVLGRVDKETDALDHPLPKGEINSTTWAYAHGLTPPMRWVRRRRFRKRISTYAIEQVEAEVERLLRMDADSRGESRYDLIDPHRMNEPAESDEDALGEADADGEADEEMEDYFEAAVEEEVEGEEAVDAAALEAEWEAAMDDGGLFGDEEDDASSSLPTVAGGVPAVTDSDPATPAATGRDSKEDSGDDVSDEAAQSMDEDEMEQRANLQRQREEITDLETAIQDQLAEMGRVQSEILQRKIQKKIQSLQDDLAMKRTAIGESTDE